MTFIKIYARLISVKRRLVMKKNLGLLSFLAALVCAISVNSVRAADFNVAIVDVPQLVSSSAQVQALKKDQQAKAEEMVKFIENARKSVADITDATKKKAAEDKYNKEFQAKKEKMDKDYANKLKEIDDSISKQINEQAKAKGYDLVLSKNMVLYGGQDITAELIKTIK